jgi:hypothetical protein
VGKTELSLTLCERFGGEVVGADSRQIYRMMDIGTAKPTPAELARAPHHLVSIRNPDQVLTLAEYQELAFAAIDDIHARGGVPFLVGGTVMYLRAVVEGLRILGPGPDERGGLAAFVMEGIHHHDLAAIVDQDGIAVRAGHHCAQPLHEHYGVSGSARASFYLYNTRSEIDKLRASLEKAQRILAF